MNTLLLIVVAFYFSMQANVGDINLTRKDMHMQAKCAVCDTWLESDVCQTSNGHKFHESCLKEELRHGGICKLCVEDKIVPEQQCYKKKVAFRDVAAMRDIGVAEVKCDNCGFVATYKEMKMRHKEIGCEPVGCSCVIC